MNVHFNKGTAKRTRRENKPTKPPGHINWPTSDTANHYKDGLHHRHPTNNRDSMSQVGEEINHIEDSRTLTKEKGLAVQDLFTSMAVLAEILWWVNWNFWILHGFRKVQVILPKRALVHIIKHITASQSVLQYIAVGQLKGMTCCNQAGFLLVFWHQSRMSVLADLKKKKKKEATLFLISIPRQQWNNWNNCGNDQSQTDESLFSVQIFTPIHK